jgi:hypothetical protein
MENNLVNTEGCPPGYATDEVMFHFNTPNNCDMAVPAYLSIGCILIVIKVLIATQHTRTWLHRRQNMRGSAARRRLPLVPMLSWLMVFCYVPFFVLSFLNVGNVSNGIPAALFGSGWFLIGLFCLFYLFKFVSLGRRIIPQHRGFRSASKMQSDDSKDDDDVDATSSFDVTGRLSVIFCVIALAGQTICFVILSLAIPNDPVILRVGFGFQAWFIIQHFFSIMHHFQRVKEA